MSPLAPARLAGLILALVPLVAFAAPGDHQWSLGVNGGGAHDVDGSGRVYGAGTYFGTIDFGGGPMSSINIFNGDVFLVGLDPNGAHQWSASITPVGPTDGLRIDAVAARPGGGFYLAGHMFTGSIDFGGGPIGASGELVVAHFDASGNHVWSASFGSATANDVYATDTHLAITGRTSNSVDFGGGTLTSAGSRDAFLALLATDGTHVFSSLFGDTDDQRGRDVVITPGGEVVLLASIEGTTDFGGGPFTVTDFNPDLVLARFDLAGTHQSSVRWVGQFSSGPSVTSSALAVSSAGDLGIVGELVGSIDFGGGMLTSNQTDAFLLRLDSSTAHLDSRVLGGDGFDGGQGAAFDADGNFVVSGTFSTSIDLGGGPIPTTGASDLFVIAFSPAGLTEWSGTWGTAGSEYLSHVQIGPGRSETVLLAGGGSALDFGGGTLAGTSYALASLAGIGGGVTGVDRPEAGPALNLAAAPNPFRHRSAISFSLPTAGPVQLTVHDVAGRRIETLASGGRSAGPHSVSWEGARASGVYFLRLQTERGVETQRIVQRR